MATKRPSRKARISANLTKIGTRAGHGIPRPKVDGRWDGGTFELDGHTCQPWSHGPGKDLYWVARTTLDGAPACPILVNRVTGQTLQTWEKADSERAHSGGTLRVLTDDEVRTLGYDLGSTLVHRISGDRVKVNRIDRRGKALFITVVTERGFSDRLPTSEISHRYRPDGPPKAGTRVTRRRRGLIRVVTSVTESVVTLDTGVTVPIDRFWTEWF